MTSDATTSLGERAANLKWRDGSTWPQVYDTFPDCAPYKVRAAARRYKSTNPDEFPTAETPFDAHPQALGVQFQEDGNTAEAKSLSTQIKSPDELIAAASVDMEVWEIDDFRVKSYDGWRADTEKDLRWEDGGIVEGFVRSGGIITKTLWSVAVKFTRRNPEPLKATFSLIECPVVYPVPAEHIPTQPVKALLFSDAHIGFDKDQQSGKLRPFHDRAMLDVIAQVASDYQPDYIGVLGDMFDLARWSRRWADDPEFYWTTQPALFEGYWTLRRLRELCPDARIVYLEGNHEVRLPNYVRDHVIEACGLRRIAGRFPTLSIPNLLAMDALKAEWVGGYNDGKATFRPAPWMVWEHGNIARTPGGTAKAIVEKAVRWRFSGHTHRCEVASRSFEESPNDEHAPVSAISFGCCCHTDGRLPGSALNSQWQKRFGIVEFQHKAPPPTVEIIPVRAGEALWRGRCYRGRDYVEELRTTWGDWNW